MLTNFSRMKRISQNINIKYSTDLVLGYYITNISPCVTPNTRGDKTASNTTATANLTIFAKLS